MKRRIVLCGGGHAHLFVASRAREFLQRDTELLVIDPGVFWYSGMATGLLSGRYSPDQDCVDIGRLVHASGGTHVPGRVKAIDPAAHTLRTDNDREIRYDLVSLNIGSKVAPRPLGCEQANVWPVKPISRLHELHRLLVDSICSGRTTRCLVVGGGSTGCEAAGNLIALFRRYGLQPDVRLLTAGERLCPNLPAPACERIADSLRRRGASLHFGQRIREIHAHSVLTASGQNYAFDQLVLATGLQSNQLQWEGDTPYAPGPAGIEVGTTLQSAHDPDLFATGDCAALRGHRLPKIGVFGVRQAPILHHNLLARLDGTTLKHYRPQQAYLSIVNLGESQGLAVRGKLWWFGRASMWLKEWLDRRFVAAYQRRAKAGQSH